LAADDNRITRISGRLLAEPQTINDLSVLKPDWQPPVPPEKPPVAAAVLIALVRREAGLSVLYTERSPDLRSHSGQIAFPGGKIDPDDPHVAAAALREAAEEVALNPAEADVIGYMPPYFSGTNYLITPVVAIVEPSMPFVANPREVRSLFEVPLPLLAREESYSTYRLKRGALEHTTWQVIYEGRTIWGITANLTRRFRDLALAGEEW
jgi:8-oxo-dGTP pyrophosphatase MutT (NUDIX family)